MRAVAGFAVPLDFRPKTSHNVVMSRQSLDEKLRSIGWTVTESGCWEWKGARNHTGYGVFRARAFGIDRALAHRVMYEQAVGPIPGGLMLRHHCDNTPCVNPDHLVPGTAADNSQDMLERGRQRKPGAPNGDRAARAAALAAEGKSMAEAAADLGVSRRTVSALGVEWPKGRPKVPDAEASARTLRRRARSSSGEAAPGQAERRARGLAMLAEGVPPGKVAAELGVRPETVSRWRRA